MNHTECQLTELPDQAESVSEFATLANDMLESLVASSVTSDGDPQDTESTTSAPKQTGAIIGSIGGFDESGKPLVVTAANKNPCVAQTVVAPNKLHEGAPVVLLFEQGDISRPIVIAELYEKTSKEPASESVQQIELPVLQDSQGQELAATVDDERMVLTAKREIVLKCGKASLTLTRAGKVIIRGAYISSRSSGVNRIKGGSVQIN